MPFAVSRLRLGPTRKVHVGGMRSQCGTAFCSGEILKSMPWPRAFEKDAFLRPDFTALEVLVSAAYALEYRAVSSTP